MSAPMPTTPGAGSSITREPDAGRPGPPAAEAGRRLDPPAVADRRERGLVDRAAALDVPDVQPDVVDHRAASLRAGREALDQPGRARTCVVGGRPPRKLPRP